MDDLFAVVVIGLGVAAAVLGLAGTYPVLKQFGLPLPGSAEQEQFVPDWGPTSGNGGTNTSVATPAILPQPTGGSLLPTQGGIFNL